jgi:hypothetical protein
MDQPIVGSDPPARRPPTNAFAIAALVMGFWCFTVVGGLFALLFGAIALDQIKESGEDGESMARAAIILGCVGVAVGVVGIIALWTILANSSASGPVIVTPG